MPPQLVADRFLYREHDTPLDVASGEPVFLRVTRGRASRVDAAWADRCAALTRLAHPWMADCLDFGLLGAAMSFEAYRLAPPFVPVPTPLLTLRGVRAFLRKCDLDVALECHAFGPAHLVVPAVRGLPTHPPDPLPDAPRPSGRRVLLPPAGVIEAFAERLRDEPRSGVAWCNVAARPGSGGGALLRFVAREGRLVGWVPVCVSLLGPSRDADSLRDLLFERHVLVLHDARRDGAPARDAACAAIARLPFVTRAACLVLRLVSPQDGADLTLRRFTAAERRRALIPGHASGHRWRSSKASGHGAWSMDIAPSREAPRHVREAHAAFTAGPPLRLVPPVAPAAPARHAHDVSLVVASAREALARGRHAAAERLLRGGAAAAVRRADHGGAGVLWLALGRLLVARGRDRAALAPIEAAATCFSRTGDLPGSVEAAILLGTAALATLDADRAASAFRSGVAAARASGLPGLARLAEGLAASGLWWLGEYGEARALLDRFDFSRPAADADPVAIRAHAAAARLALAAGESHEASRHVVMAMQAARLVSAAITGAAGTASADAVLARLRWLATVGDVSGLQAFAIDALHRSRTSRDPSTTLEIRLLRAEGALRARSYSAAHDAARGFEHLAGHRVSPLAAARARLVRHALGRRSDAERLRDVLVARGFRSFANPDAAGLALPPAASIPRSSPMEDDVVEMLRVCQEDEPRAALVRVAELVRLRCSAAMVAIATSGSAPATFSVPPTPRAAIVAVRRALDSGAAIDLHRADTAQEAAVPLRAGGAIVGAMGCRWINHPPPDSAAIRRLLEIAAAAAAPCARALHPPDRGPRSAAEDCDMVGGSEAIEAVRRSILQAADAPFPVIVEGESGSGKELVARAIHRSSVRRARPFCAVNGAALPDDLLEAELFGHAKGAFTGAIAERRGLFEEADGGVLFLDEVGELSPRAQAKLLRVIQDGDVRRIGETHVRRVDVRLVTATNRTLEAEVEAGRFRRDLFYRLAVIRIRVPPLRERQDDVPALAAELWMKATMRVGSRAVLAAGTLATLARYDWPGNVRELQNVLAALAVSAPRRGVVGPSALPAAIAQAASSSLTAVTLEEARRHFEARFVRAALARAGGHRARAAADLGLTRQGLAKVIERLGLLAEAAGE